LAINFPVNVSFFTFDDLVKVAGPTIEGVWKSTNRMEMNLIVHGWILNCSSYTDRYRWIQRKFYSTTPGAATWWCVWCATVVSVQTILPSPSQLQQFRLVGTCTLHVMSPLVYVIKTQRKKLNKKVQSFQFYNWTTENLF
jgi:hypothetical protein